MNKNKINDNINKTNKDTIDSLSNFMINGQAVKSSNIPPRPSSRTKPKLPNYSKPNVISNNNSKIPMNDLPEAPSRQLSMIKSKLLLLNGKRSLTIDMNPNQLSANNKLNDNIDMNDSDDDKSNENINILTNNKLPTERTISTEVEEEAIRRKVKELTSNLKKYKSKLTSNINTTTEFDNNIKSDVLRNIPNDVTSKIDNNIDIMLDSKDDVKSKSYYDNIVLSNELKPTDISIEKPSESKVDSKIIDRIRRSLDDKISSLFHKSNDSNIVININKSIHLDDNNQLDGAIDDYVHSNVKETTNYMAFSDSKLDNKLVDELDLSTSLSMPPRPPPMENQTIYPTISTSPNKRVTVNNSIDRLKELVVSNTASDKEAPKQSDNLLESKIDSLIMKSDSKIDTKTDLVSGSTKDLNQLIDRLVQITSVDMSLSTSSSRLSNDVSNNYVDNWTNSKTDSKFDNKVDNELDIIINASKSINHLDISSHTMVDNNTVDKLDIYLDNELDTIIKKSEDNELINESNISTGYLNNDITSELDNHVDIIEDSKISSHVDSKSSEDTENQINNQIDTNIDNNLDNQADNNVDINMNDQGDNQIIIDVDSQIYNHLDNEAYDQLDKFEHIKLDSHKDGLNDSQLNSAVHNDHQDINNLHSSSLNSKIDNYAINSIVNSIDSHIDTEIYSNSDENQFIVNTRINDDIVNVHTSSNHSISNRIINQADSPLISDNIDCCNSNIHDHIDNKEYDICTVHNQLDSTIVTYVDSNNHIDDVSTNTIDNCNTHYITDNISDELTNDVNELFCYKTNNLDTNYTSTQQLDTQQIVSLINSLQVDQLADLLGGQIVSQLSYQLDGQSYKQISSHLASQLTNDLNHNLSDEVDSESYKHVDIQIDDQSFTENIHDSHIDNNLSGYIDNNSDITIDNRVDKQNIQDMVVNDSTNNSIHPRTYPINTNDSIEPFNYQSNFIPDDVDIQSNLLNFDNIVRNQIINRSTNRYSDSIDRYDFKHTDNYMCEYDNSLHSTVDNKVDGFEDKLEDQNNNYLSNLVFNQNNNNDDDNNSDCCSQSLDIPMNSLDNNSNVDIDDDSSIISRSIDSAIHESEGITNNLINSTIDNEDKRISSFEVINVLNALHNLSDSIKGHPLKTDNNEIESIVGNYNVLNEVTNADSDCREDNTVDIQEPHTGLFSNMNDNMNSTMNLLPNILINSSESINLNDLVSNYITQIKINIINSFEFNKQERKSDIIRHLVDLIQLSEKDISSNNEITKLIDVLVSIEGDFVNEYGMNDYMQLVGNNFT